MKKEVFSSIKSELQDATKLKNHPFRYVALATTDAMGIPHTRTVVLRSVDNDLNMLVYTDQRSNKIAHINHQNKVSLLFLDPKKFIQIAIQAVAEIITDAAALEKLWAQIPEKSKKEYSSKFTPGTQITNNDRIKFLVDQHFFTAIRFTPEKIEYLKLGRHNHIRVLFEKNEDNWKGVFLAP